MIKQDYQPVRVKQKSNLIKTVLNQGARCDIVDQNGFCAILKASKFGCLECCKLILNRWPEEIDRVDAYDRSLLFHDFFNIIHFNTKSIFKQLPSTVTRNTVVN